MKILVLGSTGLIGSTTLRVLSEHTDWEVFGSIRSECGRQFFSPAIARRLLINAELSDHKTLQTIFDRVSPDVVVNCAGLTKHVAAGNSPITAIALNSLLPHQLANFCAEANARLIHISTDCVFSGKRGNYTEKDQPDSDDIYGRSKALGEVHYPHTITLRTSTIGHELQTSQGLLDWFLSQQGSCKGYTRAIFSGLPTVVFARVIRDIVIPRPELSGLYHVAGKPIAKYELLRLIAEVYEKSIEIIPDDSLVIDRSLIASRILAATGYQAPDWPELIRIMHSYKF